MRSLLYELRYFIAETFVGWALRVMPMETASDRAFGEALIAALRVSVARLECGVWS